MTKQTIKYALLLPDELSTSNKTQSLGNVTIEKIESYIATLDITFDPQKINSDPIEPHHFDEQCRPLRLLHQLLLLRHPEKNWPLSIIPYNIISNMATTNNELPAKMLNLMLVCREQPKPKKDVSSICEDLQKWYSRFQQKNEKEQLKRIRMAIEFYDAARYISNLFAQVVMLVSGMEILFIPERTSRKKNLLAARMANFLCDGDEKAFGTYKLEVTNLYDFRNQIVHSGGKKVSNQGDTFDVENKTHLQYPITSIQYLRHSLIKLLDEQDTWDKFITNNNFLQELENKPFCSLCDKKPKEISG